MLYIIGTKKETEKIKGLISNEVFTEVSSIAKILDEAYGEDRSSDQRAEA